MLYSNYLRDKSQNAIKIKEIEGVPSILKHSKGKDIKKYEIYGNNIQDGTPTPDTPIEIQSVGDLVTDTASEHYGKYDIPITVKGKNLLPYPYYSSNTTVYGMEYKINSDGSITLNGTATRGNSGFMLIDINHTVKFKAGTYTSSGNPIKDGVRLWVRNASSGSILASVFNGNSVTITLTEDTDMYCYLSVNEGTVVDNVTLYPQLEFGNVATDYEPYIEPITTNIYLNEPLRKIGDYADYIDYKNKKVVRNIYKRVFVGTENWIDTNVGRFYLMISAISGLPSNKIWCLCNRLIAQTWDTIWNNYKLQDGSYVVGIARKSDALQVTPYQTKPTLDEWKAQLAAWNEEGNPFTVWYVDSPREETISLPALKTFKGTSIMSVDTTIQPSNIKTKYVSI